MSRVRKKFAMSLILAGVASPPLLYSPVKDTTLLFLSIFNLHLSLFRFYSDTSLYEFAYLKNYISAGYQRCILADRQRQENLLYSYSSLPAHDIQFRKARINTVNPSYI